MRFRGRDTSLLGGRNFPRLSDLDLLGRFFILIELHDCFICVGKDPERIYSSFQLNLKERAYRQLRARFNRKFEKSVTCDQAFIQDLLHSQRSETFIFRRPLSKKLEEECQRIYT